VSLALYVLLALAALVAAFWLMRRELARSIELHLRAALKIGHEEFLTLASERLGTERAQQTGELEVRRQAVESAVSGLKEQLVRYERLIQDFEKDRAAKYGSLQQQLTATAQETKALHHTTAQLTAMLGNVKLRGQWGEKAAEDILRLCGLQEQMHYVKQQQAGAGRPDFTFLLPHEQRCYMDVKFPLDNYVRMAGCERAEEQKTYREQFLKDVRAHLRELERRDYAPRGSVGPDYILMFIPNEQVYGAVNEWLPGLIDEALAKRIVLCGPWSLYAQVRLIWQAWETYYHAQALGEITKTVSEFLADFKRFQERFGHLGEELRAGLTLYEDIVRVSYAQLSRRIAQIEEYRKGQGVSMPVAALTVEAPAPALTGGLYD
jgi:DNA recombination protein RmuC